MGKRRIPRYQREGEGGDALPGPPRRRITADLTKQVPSDTMAPPLFYEDTPFVCAECGNEEVWTAEQQQWWYEVAQGSIYSCATRCHDCRKARRDQQQSGSPKPQPIRHVGTLMKLLRSQIDPSLTAAGFVYESRNKPRHPGDRVWIDYRRFEQTLSLSYEHCDARLIAEFLDESGDCATVAIAEIPQPPSDRKVLETAKTFAAAIQGWLTAGS